MTTPQTPSGMMTDTFEFLKNLWAGMGIPTPSMPGLAMPMLSVEELDKRIGDLKAVEAWLNLNMSMLRGSIQALEVQRATVSTLHTMGSALADAVKLPEGEEHSSLLASVPYASAFFAGTRKAAQQAAGQSAPKGGNGAGKTNGWGAASSAAEADKPATAAGQSRQAPEAGAALPNAGTWWDMLQDQFKQAVSTAVGPEAADRMEAAGKAMTTGDATALFAPPAKKAAAKPRKTATAAPAAKSTRSRAKPARKS